MDALLFAFVAAALAGIGDQTQVVAATLSARTGKPGRVLAGLAVAAAAMACVGFFAGSLIHEMISVRAQAQLVALALAFGGIVGLMKPTAPRLAERFRRNAFIAALLFGGYAASSGRIEFMTLAFVARAELPLLAAVGGGLGLLAAVTPAALLGEAFLKLELRWLRIGIAIVFLIAAALVYLNAPPATA